MKTAIRWLVLVLVGLAPSWAFAQPGPGRGFRGVAGGEGMLGLIRAPEVRQEIELMDDQQAQLQAISQELRDQFREEMRGVFRELGDLSDDQRRERFQQIQARAEELRSEAQRRAQAVLLPHQFERLKQIDLQARMQRGGAGTIVDGQLAETLGLTDAQREQLRQRAAEVERETQEKVAQLRLEARNKLLEVLTPEQRAQLNAMLGADFQLSQAALRPGPGLRQGFGRRAARDQQPPASDAPETN